MLAQEQPSDPNPIQGDLLSRLYDNARLMKWLHGLWQGRRTNPLAIMGSLILVLLGGSVVASAFSSALVLPTPGVGFLRHYGNMSILIVFPLVGAALAISAARYRTLAEALPHQLDANGVAAARNIRDITRKFAQPSSVRWRIAKWGLYSIGWSFVLWNTANNAFWAVSVYHHDVYDSAAHPTAFIWTRIAFLLLWGVITPACALFWLRLVVMGRRAIQLVSPKSPLRLSALLYSRTRKGPYYRYVTGLLWPLVPLTGVIAALYATHGVTVPLVLGTSVFTAAMFVLLASVLIPYGRAFNSSVECHWGEMATLIDESWTRVRKGRGDATEVGDETEDYFEINLERWHCMIEKIPAWTLPWTQSGRLAIMALSPVWASFIGELIHQILTQKP